MSSIDDELLRQQEEEQERQQQEQHEEQNKDKENEAGDNGNENGDGNGNGGGNDNGNGNGNGRGPSASDRLAALANDKISLLFKDQYEKAHAVVYIIDHYEIVRVESNKFKRYLSRIFYESEHQIIKTDSITNVIQVIQAKAEFEGQTIPLSLRVAWNSGDMYFDLTNDKWQYIRISKEGYWQLINNESPNPLFVRHNQTPQVIPDRDYEADIFDRFLQLTNLKEEEDRILLKVYIISLFVPEIPHVILILHGRQGSAKSTLQTMIKLLVDPAKPKLLTIYNDVKEFIQQLAHNHIAYYDNLKKAPGWLSDEACKAVTGVGRTKRKLYSDDDDIVYEYKRCIGFSGINAALTEPDALDRSMMIELLRINPENRKDEKVILTEFLELRPKLLGYIFDILANAIQIRDTITLHDSPRMADFALWGEAIARAMGYKELEFLNAYYENIGKQNIEVIENHPLGQVIVRYIGEHQSCEGSPSEVLDKLETYAIQNNIKTDHRLWPKAANSFTRWLNQISSNLLEGPGIDVQITRTTTGVKSRTNTSVIKISLLSQIPPVSPVSPGIQNHEGNPVSFPGDTLVPGDIIPPGVEIPPGKYPQNHVQNEVPGGPGGIGDIFSTGPPQVPSVETDPLGPAEPKVPSPPSVNGPISPSSNSFRCYHNGCKCGHACDFQTDNKEYYERHGALRHTNNPLLYPTKAEIEQYELKPQGKDWEV